MQSIFNYLVLHIWKQPSIRIIIHIIFRYRIYFSRNSFTFGGCLCANLIQEHRHLNNNIFIILFVNHSPGIQKSLKNHQRIRSCYGHCSYLTKVGAQHRTTEVLSTAALSMTHSTLSEAFSFIFILQPYKQHILIQPMCSKHFPLYRIPCTVNTK